MTCWLRFAKSRFVSCPSGCTSATWSTHTPGQKTRTAIVAKVVGQSDPHPRQKVGLDKVHAIRSFDRVLNPPLGPLAIMNYRSGLPPVVSPSRWPASVLASPPLRLPLAQLFDCTVEIAL